MLAKSQGGGLPLNSGLNCFIYGIQIYLNGVRIKILAQKWQGRFLNKRGKQQKKWGFS